MKKISIICACNNDELYENMLVASLDKQTYRNYELVKLNSAELGFKSAAQTLNYGAEHSSGDILVFVHQDIEFLHDDALQRIVDYCDTEEFGVGGVAGVIAGIKKVYSSVVEDVDRQQAGERTDEIMSVDTLDECLFFVKRSDFKGFVDYGSWHFYAVEYSLRVKRAGEKVLVLPVDVFHLSPGWSLNKSYWKTLKKVAKNHRECKIIPTTMGQYKNNAFLPVNILLRRIKRKLKCNPHKKTP